MGGLAGELLLLFLPLGGAPEAHLPPFTLITLTLGVPCESFPPTVSMSGKTLTVQLRVSAQGVSGTSLAKPLCTVCMELLFEHSHWQGRYVS